ncbi:hypothetical protein WN943_010550 [Citrus x changshan-huyou]
MDSKLQPVRVKFRFELNPNRIFNPFGSHFLSFVAHGDSSSQQPRPAPIDTSRSPQPTRRQPARLARNCASSQPTRVPLSPASSRFADAVAAPTSEIKVCLALPTL